jgi:hypothetical protein
MNTEYDKALNRVKEILPKCGELLNNNQARVSTTPIDVKNMVKAVQDFYELNSTEFMKKTNEFNIPSKYYVVSSPRLAVKLLDKLMDDSPEIAPKHFITELHYMYQSLKGIDPKHIPAVYSLDQLNMFDVLYRLAKFGSTFYMLSDVFILVDRPEFINRNSKGDTHCEDGPAVKYRKTRTQYTITNHLGEKETIRFRDEYSIYCIEGNVIRKPYHKYILNHDLITDDMLNGYKYAYLEPLIRKVLN